MRQNQELNLLIYDQEQARIILKIRDLRHQVSQLPLIRVLQKRHKNDDMLLNKMLCQVRTNRNALRDEIRMLNKVFRPTP